MRSLLLLFALPLAACAARRTALPAELIPTEDLAGRIVVRPVVGGQCQNGYSIWVSRNDALVASASTSDALPAVVTSLEPGDYTVKVKGPHLRAQTFAAAVRAGHATSFTIAVASAPPHEPGTRLTRTDRHILAQIFLVPFRVVWTIVRAMAHMRLGDGSNGGCERRSPAKKRSKVKF